jgi:hypothetical protein
MAFTVAPKRHLEAALLGPSAGPSKNNIAEKEIKSGFRVSGEV